MCVYCMVGDHFFKHDPPWPKQEPYPYHPAIPYPANPSPSIPWEKDRLKELEDILARIKALEDQIGCPCEPNKADYLALIKERLEQLEKTVADTKAESEGSNGQEN